MPQFQQKGCARQPLGSAQYVPAGPFGEAGQRLRRRVTQDPIGPRGLGDEPLGPPDRRGDQRLDPIGGEPVRRRIHLAAQRIGQRESDLPGTGVSHRAHHE